jgi:hypothetical protein
VTPAIEKNDIEKNLTTAGRRTMDELEEANALEWVRLRTK